MNFKMEKPEAWHNNMPQKVKDVLDVLIEKAETKKCVDAQAVKDLKSTASWTNLPMVVDDVLELLAVNTGRTPKSLPNWASLPTRVKVLESVISSLDCRSLNPEMEKEVEEHVTVEEAIEEIKVEEQTEASPTEEVVEEEEVNVSKIKLVEYNAEEDLKGELEEINITAYFEDKSGDEVPNVGIKLYKDKALTKPLEGYKGALYFTNSKSDDKITMLLRSTGTVKKTKFKV